MTLALLTFLMLFQFDFAAASTDKTSCHSRELKRQDCRLSLGAFRLRLLPDTIARDDGTWHTVDPMPLRGEGVAWERTSLDPMGGKKILQLWIWDKGIGETVVQSLRWYVLDVTQGEMKILSEEVVRRRRPKVVTAEEGKPAAEVQYIYDAMEKHGLKALPDNSFERMIGNKKKILGKVPGHGI